MKKKNAKYYLILKKWNKTPLLLANLMAPYTGKAKSHHKIWFLYATSSRLILLQVTELNIKTSLFNAVFAQIIMKR